jgi:hypothetical protein
MARYSDHGSVSLAACDTCVDLKRIDSNKSPREVVARMFLRDTQCKASGEGRREKVVIAMAVVLYSWTALREIEHITCASVVIRVRSGGSVILVTHAPRNCPLRGGVQIVLRTVHISRTGADSRALIGRYGPWDVLLSLLFILCI